MSLIQHLKRQHADQGRSSAGQTAVHQRGPCKTSSTETDGVSRKRPAGASSSGAAVSPAAKRPDRRPLQTGHQSALGQSKVQPQAPATAAPRPRSDVGHLARTPAPGRQQPTTLSGKLGSQTTGQTRAGQTAGQTHVGQTAEQTRAGRIAGLRGRGETLWTGPAPKSSAVPFTATVGTRRGMRTREVFAGSQHLSQALQAQGCSIQPVDIAIGGQPHDLSITANADCLKADDTEDYNHYGPPCNTYAICRRPKIRSSSFPEGLPNLGKRDQQLLRKANRITANVMRLLLGHCEKGHAWSIENPAGSLLWRTRAWRRVLRRCKPSKVTVNYCQFGMPYRKRTTIFTWSPGGENFLAELAIPCTCKGHAVSLSGWSHDHSKRFSTKGGSAAYPPALCKAWARAVVQHLKRP